VSNKVWQTRRTKKGMAARQYAAIQRQMRRDKSKTLPRTYRSRGSGIVLTVTIGPVEDRYDEEDW
jgi:hypothetical protein